MSYKVVISYVVTSVVLGVLTIPIALILKIFYKGIRLSHDAIPYLQLLLFSAIVGAVIGFTVSLLGNKNINSWLEFSICLLICLAFTTILSINFTSSLEGIWVWFSISGLILGSIIFFIQKLVFKII